jgi:hypothetical protein
LNFKVVEKFSRQLGRSRFIVAIFGSSWVDCAIYVLIYTRPIFRYFDAVTIFLNSFRVDIPISKIEKDLYFY